MNTEDITFNDLPKVVSQLLNKVTSIESKVERLSHSVTTTQRKSTENHIPMDIDEMCEYFSLKKNTIYYYLQHNMIPATKRGKRYIFFKDEILEWIESGRKPIALEQSEDINKILSKRSSRR